jgi:hypothetical protein
MKKRMKEGTKILTILAIIAVMMTIISPGGEVAQAGGPWYVAPAGNDANDCLTPATACKTIGAAIGKAGSGDTINVAAGTYDERLHIQEPVNLIGAGRSVTTITTSSAGEYLILVGENTPVTFSDGMTIEGFTLTSTALIGDSDLIMLRASGPNSTNRIVIRNNVFDCVDQDVSVKGIETRSGGGTAHFLIENNEFINECRYGMWFNSAINGEIKGNTFTDAKYTALALCTSDLDQIHDMDIVDNTILRSGVAQHGSVWSSGMHIGSTVYNMNITGNTVADGYDYGIVIHDRRTTDLSNVHINCNNMYNNPDGFLNEVDVAVDAEYNWWGDASGPSGQGTGTGDPVSANVDYDPWLSEPVGDVCPPPPVIQVEIDIKPGSDPNCINENDHGVIPVAILSTPTFDAPTTVDPESVRLGSLEVKMAGKSGKYLAHSEDVNGDGLADLVVQIADADGQLEAGNGEATLSGLLTDGTPFEGTDTICIVPPE